MRRVRVLCELPMRSLVESGVLTGKQAPLRTYGNPSLQVNAQSRQQQTYRCRLIRLRYAATKRLIFVVVKAVVCSSSNHGFDFDTRFVGLI
jgi:hypothetical protein